MIWKDLNVSGSSDELTIRIFWTFHSCVFAGRRVTRFGNTVIRWWVSSSAAIDCRAQYCTRQALVSCIQMFMLSVAMQPHDSCCASVTSIRPGILFGILQIYMKHILFDLFLYGIFIPLCVCVRVASRLLYCTLELLWRSVFKRI